MLWLKIMRTEYKPKATLGRHVSSKFLIQLLKLPICGFTLNFFLSSKHEAPPS